MAGKVRFPLEMADGILVGNLEELKEHFDIHKVVGHYLNGKLIQWLESRFYDDEAEAVAGLDKNAPDLVQGLAAIFGVTIEVDLEIDVSTVQTRNARIAELRQSTDNLDIVKNLDRIAFDQGELDALLDKGVTTVYLYSGAFTIPLERENVKYIGIGNPVVNFSADEPVDFFAKGIKFKSVNFCENYLKLLEDAKAEEQEHEQSKAHNAESEVHESDLFQMKITDVSMEYDKAEVFGQVLFGSVEIGDKLNFTLNNGEVRPVVVRGVTTFSVRERHRYDSDIKLVLSGLSKKSFKRGKSVSK